MTAEISFAGWGLAPDAVEALGGLGIETRAWSGGALGDAIALVVDVRRGVAPVPPEGTPVLAIHAGTPPEFASVAIDARDLAQGLALRVVEIAVLGASRRTLATEREAVAGLVDLVSHDLRNPLAAIRANLGMLGTGGLDPDLVEAIDDSMMAADGALRIVDNLGLVASLEAARPVPVLGSTDGCTAVQEAVRRARPASDASAIPIAVDVPDGSVPCAVSPQVLGVLLDNLVGVALRYAPRGSEVRVRLERMADVARVVVVESSLPIPPEVASRLFDRSYQADNKRVAVGRYGRGIGLYVVGLLARACGATATCTPDGGRNAYRLDLPLDDSVGD